MKNKWNGLLIALCCIIALGGCGNGQDTKIVEKETEQEQSKVVSEEDNSEEDNSEETKPADGNITEKETEQKQSKAVYEEQKETNSEKRRVGQDIYYIDWIESYLQTTLEELPKVSENGNEYDFNENFLGYYTNGYVGFNFVQIDGDSVVVDVFLYDYFIGRTSAEVMDDHTISFVYTPGQTQSDIYGGSGVYKSELNHFETNTVFEDGRVTFNSSAQLPENFMISIIGENMAPYFLDMETDLDGNYFEFSSLELGIYDKQENSEIEKLKLINEYNPTILDPSGMTDELRDKDCYYENNQPLRDRISKDTYPKYVKYIPVYKYYIAGGNPEEKEDFILMKVMTGEEAGRPEMWSRIQIKLGAFHYYEPEQRWYTNMSDVTRDSEGYEQSTTAKAWCWDIEDTFNFINFNYELPEYICTTINDSGELLADTESYESAEEIVRENMRAESGRYNIRKITLDCSDPESPKLNIEDGKGFLTNMKMSINPLSQAVVSEQVEVPFSITDDTVFKAVTDETIFQNVGIVLE